MVIFSSCAEIEFWRFPRFEARLNSRKLNSSRLARIAKYFPDTAWETEGERGSNRPGGGRCALPSRLGGLWQDRSRFSAHTPAKRRLDDKARRGGAALVFTICLGPMKPVHISSRYSVRAAIAASLCHGDAALQHTALQLGMGPRSLQRHLAGMGTSYSDMVAEVRLDTACYLLLESNERISTIALRLGYAGTSSFSRVFMRLTRMQPVTYRRQRAVQGNDKSGPGKEPRAGKRKPSRLARNGKTSCLPGGSNVAPPRRGKKRRSNGTD
jgi:AraC-like DNA-binding protein